jgi:hypothetical protein
MQAQSRRQATSEELAQFASAAECLVETLHTLANQNDTPYVIVAASALEDLLTVVLCDNRRYLTLVEVSGRFLTFSAKINIAYKLNLIDDDLLNYLNVIRNVRNVFAHARGPLRFGSANPTLNEAFKGFLGWTESSDQRVLFDERLKACIQTLNSRLDSGIFLEAWSDAASR